VEISVHSHTQHWTTTRDVLILLAEFLENVMLKAKSKMLKNMVEILEN